MENLSGNMEKNVKSSRASRNQKKRWTILMVGEHGETVRLKGFRQMAIAGIFICIISMVAALSLFLLYQKALKENSELYESYHICNTLHGGNNTLKKPIITKSPFEFSPKLLTSHANIFNPSIPFKVEPDLKLRKELTLMPVGSYDKLVVSPKKERMGLENFKLILRHKSNAVGISFIIRNQEPSDKPVLGATFVILKTKQNQNSWVVYPDVPLRRGKPIQINKGKFFSVARYKTVKHDPVILTHPELFNKAMVLVYSSNGRLLTSKTFSIEIML
ncbi:conserved hypothetical protein [Candidatus Magnetomoraceae bacterium gMMP-15]